MRAAYFPASSATRETITSPLSLELASLSTAYRSMMSSTSALLSLQLGIVPENGRP
jgi:hypothetical protein